tara:strand:- start:1011 stop:2096 length:1086 start_codon:yes stop_codon:yes gene_type:complete
MVAFKGGNNTGGQNVDYYDNPNYDPTDEGKSKSSKKASDLGDAISDYKNAYGYHTENVEADTNLGRGGTLKSYEDRIDAQSEALDTQVKKTVSYFRGKDRERMNPGGVGGPQINPKFSQPASLQDKLNKFGFSYDPTDPDTFFDQVFRTPEQAVDQYNVRRFDTSNMSPHSGWNQETMEYKKDSPMPKTVAGVNQELQAVKARTRDAAMEFRGMVFDFIDAHRSNLIQHKNDIVNEHLRREDSGTTMMFNEKDIEDKYFPDDASKKAAKKELQKMVSFTDAASDITREYSTLGQLAETIVGDTPETPMGLMDHGIRGMVGEPKLINEAITAENYKKSLDAYSQWKSKKGIPKIVRLINKLP